MLSLVSNRIFQCRIGSRVFSAMLVLVLPVLSQTASAQSTRHLKNMDLPGYDFRSPRNDRSLVNIGRRGCNSACVNDRRCVAFTYNQNQGWCFLKNGYGRQTRFRGAYSGIIVRQAYNAPRSSYVSSDVVKVQVALNALGFNAGTPDGVQGSKTRRAIRAFQRRNGFRPTGNLTPSQKRQLLSGKTASRSSDRNTGGAGGVRSGNGVTVDASAKVIKIQVALKYAGFYQGDVDGVSGRGTKRAIRAFQASNGFRQTWNADGRTANRFAQSESEFNP